MLSFRFAVIQSPNPTMGIQDVGVPEPTYGTNRFEHADGFGSDLPATLMCLIPIQILCNPSQLQKRGSILI